MASGERYRLSPLYLYTCIYTDMIGTHADLFCHSTLGSFAVNHS